MSAFALSACSEAESEPSAETGAPAVMESNWDGVTKAKADNIVTLEMPEIPAGILVNGEPAKVNIGFGEVKVLIEADETGLSCQNSYIVTFASGEKGQLLANHCHGDARFKITPGEMTEELVTKADVDNPDDDIEVESELPEPGTSLAMGWSANGFEQLPDRYKWMGGQGDDAFFALGVPETDDSVWVSRCDKGQLVSMVFVNDDKLAENAKSTLTVETDKGAQKSYAVKAEESGMGPAYVVRNKAGAGPLTQMLSGDWLYLQMGEGDGAGKVRISLSGARDKASAMLKAC
ncbi:hypothetical protein FGU71_13985 [Erythrobacter insulae]|uniref:Uncharacterized protein n=1 Tax=Erythrobacter insulae TaxID=2584124 RepID=A0A547P7H7_9SPHN|nr:hypothetical protein [Erythrobacter insulae]TRD10093.1 hypothetical protein FGU71_13985 [Erythrobacter insulae]